MNPNVDLFLNGAKRWREELEKLRTIILACHLTEEVKWHVPVYTFQKKNIVGINGLKECCALAFFKGGLLKDSHGILTKPGRNSQAGRWIKFANVREIAEMEPILKAYIDEAIEVERVGLKVVPKKVSELNVPVEFTSKLKQNPALKKAFHALTPGRQRAYIFHFSAAKQSKTRESRIDKCTPQILNGKGLGDR
jgi:uncharacterized protein YdeI (YjbR/CyaY-like superfamily)